MTGAIPAARSLGGRRRWLLPAGLARGAARIATGTFPPTVNCWERSRCLKETWRCLDATQMHLCPLNGRPKRPGSPGWRAEPQWLVAAAAGVSRQPCGSIRASRMGAAAVACGASAGSVSRQLRLHPGEPDGGGCSGLWAAGVLAVNLRSIRASRMGASRSGLWARRALAVNLALHPGEPDGGERSGLWARRGVLAVNLALHSGEPDGGVCGG